MVGEEDTRNTSGTVKKTGGTELERSRTHTRVQWQHVHSIIRYGSSVLVSITFHSPSLNSTDPYSTGPVAACFLQYRTFDRHKTLVRHYRVQVDLSRAISKTEKCFSGIGDCPQPERWTFSRPECCRVLQKRSQSPVLKIEEIFFVVGVT